MRANCSQSTAADLDLKPLMTAGRIVSSAWSEMSAATELVDCFRLLPSAGESMCAPSIEVLCQIIELLPHKQYQLQQPMAMKLGH